MTFDNMITPYEEDCIWMSYRYCIGRHTIASQMHASNIAKFNYKKLSKSQMERMSEDINREIFYNLKFSNLLKCNSFDALPSNLKRPLDLLYQAFDENNINSIDKVKSLSNVEVLYKDNLIFNCYYNNNNLSMMDFTDLEIWQKLANLFDVDNYKRCKLKTGEIIEYFEHWTQGYDKDRNIIFYKLKVPTHLYKNLYNCISIKEDSIETDNIK